MLAGTVPINATHIAIMSLPDQSVVFGTEDLLMSLCNSVTRVLSVATQSQVHYSGMVQRISKPASSPTLAALCCSMAASRAWSSSTFGLAAMELYQSYLLSMGMSKEDLVSSYTSDEVSNVMGELMNQVVGDFTGKIRRELQTHITQNQPKMLVLNKQVMLSVDANLDNPEARRVTFYTGNNNIFYLNWPSTAPSSSSSTTSSPRNPDPDALMAQAHQPAPAAAAPAAATDSDTDDLLKSLGMRAAAQPRRSLRAATRGPRSRHRKPRCFFRLDFTFQLSLNYGNQ
jgi:hypothetical protein